MKIRISASAEAQLQHGFRFYERQAPDLGGYFLDSLMADIDSLHIHAGVHIQCFGRYHRMLAKRFPFSIYYRIENRIIQVYAVLDNRRSPEWIRKTLLRP